VSREKRGGKNIEGQGKRLAPDPFIDEIRHCNKKKYLL
jgi:hypothetical protein